jgi:hypothetical protein
MCIAVTGIDYISHKTSHRSICFDPHLPARQHLMPAVPFPPPSAVYLHFDRLEEEKEGVVSVTCCLKSDAAHA